VNSKLPNNIAIVRRTRQKTARWALSGGIAKNLYNSLFS
jgi:hypothetical protein